jgi:hypothetical protein
LISLVIRRYAIENSQCARQTDMSIEILEYVVELAIILLTETKSNDVELKGIEANLVVGTPDPLVNSIGVNERPFLCEGTKAITYSLPDSFEIYTVIYILNNW